MLMVWFCAFLMVLQWFFDGLVMVFDRFVVVFDGFVLF